MRITTERLLLGEFVATDWPAVLAYQRDPRYLRLYPWTGRTEADVRDFVQVFVDQQGKQPRRRFQLAITLGAMGAIRQRWRPPVDQEKAGPVIGSCGIRRKPESGWEADIGYELAPEHWGRGYATEVALAMVDFGFRELGLHRISSRCIADNAASARVLEKVGLRLEGRLRENEYFKGRWWDTLLYGLLESEWRASATD